MRAHRPAILLPALAFLAVVAACGGEPSVSGLSAGEWAEVLDRAEREDVSPRLDVLFGGGEPALAVLERAWPRLGMVGRATVASRADSLDAEGGRVLALLRRALVDGDPRVRMWAVWTAGKVRAGAGERADLLAAACADPHPGVRYLAAVGLEEIGAAAAGREEVLLSTWERQPGALRAAFLAAISAVAPERAETAEALLRELDRRAPFAEPEARAPPLAGGGELPLRAGIRMSLMVATFPARAADGTEIDRDRILGEMEYELAGGDPPLGELLAAIGRAGSATIPGLLERLGRRSPASRALAARALGGCGERSAETLAALRAALADPDARVRLAAAGALHALGRGSPEVSGTARALLAGEGVPPEIAAGAARLLGETGAAGEALRALLGALDHEAWEAREEAAYALAGAVGQGGEVSGALARTLSADPSVRVRFAVLDTLLRREDIAEGCVPALIASLGSGEPEMRRRAVLALGRLSARRHEALFAVAEATEDGAEAVRGLARELLGEAGAGPIREELRLDLGIEVERRARERIAGLLAR